MSKKLSKQEVRSPDAFIAFTDRIVKQFENYSKPITLAFIIAALAGGGIVAMDKYNEHNEKLAQGALYKIENQEQTVSETIAKDGREVNFAEDYSAVVENYKNFIDENKGTKASFIAAINAAAILQENEMYAEANEVLNKVKATVEQDNFFYGMLYSQLGAIELARKQYEAAIETFLALTQNPHQSHIHPDATLKLAIAYQEAGQKDKSLEQLRKLKDNFSETDAAQKASSYLRLFSLGE